MQIKFILNADSLLLNAAVSFKINNTHLKYVLNADSLLLNVTVNFK